MGKKIGIVGLLLLVVAVGAFYGHKYLKEQEAKDKAYAIIKNCTVRTSTVLDYFLVDSQMTFAETFKNIENNVSELDTEALNLKRMNELPEEFRSEGLAYIGKCQDFMRLENQYYRKRLMSNVALSAFDRAIAELNGSKRYANEYIIDNIQERGKTALEEYIKSVKEVSEVQAALKSYAVSFGAYLVKASKSLNSAYLISTEQVEKIVVNMTPKATNSTNSTNATNSTAGTGS